MYMQDKLFKKEDLNVVNVDEITPVIKVVRNRFLVAGALVVEEITKKTWIKPLNN